MQSGDTVLMAHGSGGTMMRDIIEQLFFEAYAGDTLRRADDAAVLGIPSGRMAFSTDTFVVTPHFFPGGDIGHLAICGTVNDVATSGAIPRYLSCGFVLEEGYPLENLRRICASMAATAKEAGVEIVTGDTKVVNRGHGDGVYINTAGVGELREGVELSGSLIKPGDKVLISGSIGDHGIAIISTREELSFSTQIESDAAPLNHLIADVLDACPAGCVRAFRDPTRGGLSSTLNEFAESSGVDIRIEEDDVPVHDQVRGACEMLGYDVFQVANEGKMVCVCAPEAADAALAAMRANTYGSEAAIIGEVAEGAGRVYLHTAFGSERILDMLVGEQLPRIC
jgi:hydrogenase expression/formation protein HypE